MTIAVGMSGGLDSTMSALLLKESGEQVVGLTMKIWAGEAQPGGAHKSGCYGPGELADIEDARLACERIGIPHHVVDLTEEYARIVLDDFSEEYLDGRTPNPCILCNPLVKFGAMLRKARASGIEFTHFATGHYAHITFDNVSGRYWLRKGLDPLKDQSYYLYRLNQAQLGQVLFPLGGYTKKQVRELAKQKGFSEYVRKPESQNFTDGGNYQSFFKEEEIHTGEIVDLQGKVLGKHSGIHNFTIGQRKGLRIGGLAEPLYVIEKDVASGRVTVGPKKYLQFNELTAGQLNWIAFENLTQPLSTKASFRYHQPPAECQVLPLDDKHICVVFDQSQSAATPGQSVVLYSGDVVLGGGIIESVQRLY